MKPKAASAPPKGSATESSAKIFSLVQAAAVLGVHRNTLAKWIDLGCPVERRADRARGIEWEISIPAVVDWRIKKAVDDTVAIYGQSDGGVSQEAADRRRALANAITAEIEADKALDEVVSRGEAIEDVTAFCQVLKTGLSNASARIASRAASMSSAPEIQEMVQEELNRSFRAAQGDLSQRWNGDGASDRGGG